MTAEHRPQDRASDADRDEAATLIGEALADGRLTAEEHTQRINTIYAAKTYADLVPATADLGIDRQLAARGRTGDLIPQERVHPQIAILSSSLARPTGRVGGHMVAVGLLGNARIDLSHATIEDAGAEITANAIMGAVDIVVPVDARVTMTGLPFLGSLSPTVEPGPVDGPRVNVRAFALLGSVTIHRAEPEDTEE